MVEYLSLKKSSTIWAKRIIATKNVVRKNRAYEIKENGYDINSEIKKLENFYINMMSNNN